MNSRSRMTLKSSVVIFRALETSAASLTSAASATSLASTASTALFPQKKLPDPDGLIINDMKMTNTGPFLWNESSKIQIFPNICFLFCRRLLRPKYVTFLKTGWWNSNSPISGIYWYLQTKSNLHISIHQRQFKIYTLPWGTLYHTYNLPNSDYYLKNVNCTRKFVVFLR